MIAWVVESELETTLLEAYTVPDTFREAIPMTEEEWAQYQKDVKAFWDWQFLFEVRRDAARLIARSA